MDMRDGTIHELNKEEQNELLKYQKARSKTRKMMAMTAEQVDAVQDMPSRKARRYMLAQPCDCGSGKKAKNCCFGKVSQRTT